jgi:diguanylate cyclase (GGDEF)-like protein/PAS domain S-box-containing protein
MLFRGESVPNIDINILEAAVMDSRGGITIADFTLPVNPLIFVNPSFEKMTGYLSEEIVGKNCRYLQGEDKSQEDRVNIIREAIKNQQPCLVTLRNYRKDGSMFWNELSISPIFNDKGMLTNYLGIQQDVTNIILMQEKVSDEYNKLRQSNTMAEYLINIDALTGIYNRRYFEEQLRIQSQIAKRQKQLLTIFMLDIDHFKKYNDTYGQPAGDQVLKQVAEVLSSSFMKSTDFVARYGGEEFIILSIGGDPEKIAKYADSVVKKVSTLSIPHSGSDKKIITVSLGFRYHQPATCDDPFDIVKKADEALYEAKGAGRNQAKDFSTLTNEKKASR